MKQNKLNLIITEVTSLRSDLKALMAAIDQNNSKKLYTKSETSQILKVSIRTLNSYMKSGKIRATYHDRAVRFTQEEINRYIEANTIQIASDGI